MEKRNLVRESIVQLKHCKRHIQWEDIEEGKTYHFPQIYPLKRREVTIIKKTEKGATFMDLDKEIKEIKPNCLIAIFLTEKKGY